MILVLTEQEEEAVTKLAADLTVPRDKVLIMALRHFQMHQTRLNDGETCTYSGDRKRHHDFASVILCQANTVNGEPCMRRPRKGTEYCAVHGYKYR
jgi:hypothetical protein